MRVNKNVWATSSRPYFEESAKKSPLQPRCLSRSDWGFSNNGITLIALIITIIVMLILVAVSISIALNTGLFESAGKATKDWITTQDAEAELGNGKVNVGGTVYNSIDEYIATIGGENTGGGATVVAGGRASKNSTYTDTAGKKAVIPAGFTVSGVPSEGTIDGGLVIYLIPEGEIVDWEDGTAVANAQKTYDQFVWIPIKNTTDANAQDINDMYICQGKTENNGACEIKVENGAATCKNTEHSTETTPNKNTLMAGRLYATLTGENFEANITEVYTSGSGLREPDTVLDYDGNSTYLGYLSSILEADVADANKEYTSIDNFKEKLQEEYNEVVKSVYENQGFYVGRYETSGMKQATSGYDVAVVAGTLPAAETDWYHMYAQQKNYAKANSLTVGSTMIQGAAYDQLLKFVDSNSTWVKKTGRVSHDRIYSSGPWQTGGLNYSGSITYNDVAKNIYDLEGNVFAWTTEANYTYSRVSRGGKYYISISASYRNNNVPSTSSDTTLGSLTQLYIK